MGDADADSGLDGPYAAYDPSNADDRLGAFGAAGCRGPGWGGLR